MKSKLSSVVCLVVMLAITAMQGANTISTESTPFTSTMVSSTEGTNNETSVSSTTDGSTTLFMTTTTEFTTSLPTTSDFTTSETTTIDIPTSQTTIEDFTTSDTSTIEFTTSPPTSINFTTFEPTTTGIDTSQSTTEDFTTSDTSTVQFTTSLPTTSDITAVATTNKNFTTTTIQSTTNNITTTKSNPPDVRSDMDVLIGLSVSLAVVTIAFMIFFVYTRLDRSKKHKDTENAPDYETKSKKSSAVDLEETSSKKHLSSLDLKSAPLKPESPRRKIDSKLHGQSFVYKEREQLAVTTTSRMDTLPVSKILVSKHCQTDKSICRSVQNQIDGTQPRLGIEVMKRQTEIIYLSANPKPATIVNTRNQRNTSIPETINAEYQTESYVSDVSSSSEHSISSVDSRTKTPDSPYSRNMDDSDSDLSIKIIDDQTSDDEFDSNPWSYSKIHFHLDEKGPVKPTRLESNGFKYKIPMVSPKQLKRKPRQRISYSRYKNVLDELLTPNRKTNGLETLQTSQWHGKLPVGKAKWQWRRTAPNL